MNFSDLLSSRNLLVRQATLANTAYAYATLTTFAQRISRAGLRGPVRLERSEGADEGYSATLTALLGSQAVIEEHFSEDDVIDLAEALAYAVDHRLAEIEFPLEALAETFLPPLRRAIERAGVVIDADHTPSPAEKQEE